ncbi:glutathione S-transferase N-terminal domain-containing protein [Herminiimonas sp. NPDC097707]|uniref:glutathione S-transferase N-terminal domain-containing protein n=1 Tax=Herminiimonas sp. NPDC097707 TaxID=3364007 RepID=UPI00383B186B
MKYFFKLVRLILGPFMLLHEQMTKPKGLVRAAADQARVDAECRQLALYQFSTCPFSIKVRQELRRLALKVELRDAQHSTENRQTLLTQGGSSKVPCLKITDEEQKTRWLYDSREIIAYLQQRFAAA